MPGVDGLAPVLKLSEERVAGEFGGVVVEQRVEGAALSEIGGTGAHVIEEDLLKGFLVARVGQFAKQLGLILGQVGKRFVTGSEDSDRAFVLQVLDGADQVVLTQQVDQGGAAFVSGQSFDGVSSLGKLPADLLERVGQTFVDGVLSSGPGRRAARSTGLDGSAWHHAGGLVGGAAAAVLADAGSHQVASGVDSGGVGAVEAAGSELGSTLKRSSRHLRSASEVFSASDVSGASE